MSKENQSERHQAPRTACSPEARPVGLRPHGHVAPGWKPVRIVAALTPNFHKRNSGSARELPGSQGHRDGHVAGQGGKGTQAPQESPGHRPAGERRPHRTCHGQRTLEPGELGGATRGSEVIIYRRPLPTLRRGGHLDASCLWAGLVSASPGGERRK